MCLLNLAFLPGYDSKVLRVRHIIHSPRLDLDENVTLNEDTLFLSQIFLKFFELQSSKCLQNI